MRISDWSSDVCSSDLRDQELFVQRRPLRTGGCPHSTAVAFTAAEGEALMLYAQVHLTLPAWVHDAVDATRTCATDEEKVALAVELSRRRSEEHTSELQSLMRISYAVFCLKKKKQIRIQ